MTNLTASAQAQPILFNHLPTLNLVLVGCGGTGSHLAPHLAMIACELMKQNPNRTVNLTFVDPDSVEAKNVPRQNFYEGDIGFNKAQCLALRYSAQFGIEIGYQADYFNPSRIPILRGSTIIIGASDNSLNQGKTARQTIHQCMMQFPQLANQPPCLWWLDLGNNENSGQVILGCATQLEQLAQSFKAPNYCLWTPVPGWVHPDLLDVDGQDEIPLSCAEMAQRNLQSLSVNRIAAAIGADYLIQLLLSGTLKRWLTYFDTETGSQFSTETSSAVIQQVMQQWGNSR